MDNASKNATDMISSLQMQYNRGRQAAITNELVDIITGECTFPSRCHPDSHNMVSQVPVHCKRAIRYTVPDRSRVVPYAFTMKYSIFLMEGIVA